MIPAKEEIQRVKPEVERYVRQRISEFKSLRENNLTTFDFRPFVNIEPYQADIFSEACFCILTANSSAVLGIKLQKEIGVDGFKSYPEEKLFEIIRKKGHRFAHQRAERIVKLREKENFLLKIAKEKDGKEAREKLVKEIYGYGYKEASHFLRNIGFNDVAIIDRHISRFLFEKGLVKPRKTITKKVYLECEQALEKIASDLELTQAELDLYIFYIKTGKVLK
ncbi:N-glycosylase/DNA lyase [Persephonella atlantica]|uniref:8-oxoguanine DNA glycosylase/AP lyase n=1 Tax=Persephonella atlantica TaxID=2699429 RepID=A0ABS1GG42_9AQUI|nr:N-glycosylase/DNA lyase [Persephonella atlantica]MBK3331850.1 N-glycosylase/DNA lyase [Persephonella atlantica]